MKDFVSSHFYTSNHSNDGASSKRTVFSATNSNRPVESSSEVENSTRKEIKHAESASANKTLRSRNNDVPKKTPGKIVIPAQFLNSIRQSSPDQRCSTASSLVSGSTTITQLSNPRDDARTCLDCMVTAATGVQEAEKQGNNEKGAAEADKEMASLFGVTRVEMARANRGVTPPPMVRLTPSMEDLATVPEASSSKETATTKESKSSIGNPSFDSTSKSNASFDSEDISEQGEKCRGLLLSSPEEEKSPRGRIPKQVENHSKTVAGKAKTPQPEENNNLSCGASLSEIELQKIRDQYERKLHEQKDAAVLATRLSKIRLEEIERLEAELKKQKTMNSVDVISSQVFSNKLSEEVQKINMQKEREVQELKAELQSVKEKLQTQDNAQLSSIIHEAEIDRLRKEVDRLKSQNSLNDSDYVKPEKDLQRGKREQDEFKEKLSSRAKGEMNRLRKELLEVKEKLAAKEREAEKEARMKTPSKEMKRLQRELSSVKKELAAAKDQEGRDEDSGEILRLRKELEEVRNELLEERKAKEISFSKTGFVEQSHLNEPAAAGLEGELGKVKKELENLNNDIFNKKKELHDSKKEQNTSNSSPFSSRFGRADVGTLSSLTPPRTGRPRMPSGSIQNEDEPNHRQAQLYEQEKESLLQQIKLMDQQAAKTSQEYERALRELKESSEQEINLVKKDMENRLAHHLEREQILKDSLSRASSREKEGLVEQIERLESEKKRDRHGGLREVQRKEDLLQYISSLEKKQKQIIEEHERTMQDLRRQSEEEIQRLRQQMKQREEEQAAKEKELQSAISRTCSYEKDDLLNKVDKLQNQLESERKGSVLLKIKVANFEKDLAATEKRSLEAIDKFEKEKDGQIQQLKQELEKRSTIEKELENASVEKLKLQNEVELLKKRLEEQNQHAKSTTETLHGSSEIYHSAEQAFKESMENLEKEKNLQIKQLKSELDKMLALEREMEITSLEKSKIQEELESVKEMLLNEKQNRQHELEQLRSEHAKAVSAAENDSLEHLRKAQRDAETVHKESIEKLVRSKDLQIKLLNDELNKKLTQEETILDEKNTMQEEIIFLKSMLDTQHNSHRLEINQIQSEHTKTIAAIKHDASERLRLAQKDAEKVYKESVEKLLRGRDIPVKQLKDELDKRLELEGTLQAISAEKNSLQQELISLKEKFQNQKQNSQTNYDKLCSEHAKAIASLQQESADRLSEVKKSAEENLAAIQQESSVKVRQSQKDCEKRLEQTQKQIETKYELLLTQAKEKIQIQANELLTKEDEHNRKIESISHQFTDEKNILLERIELLQKQMEAVKEESNQDEIQIKKQLDAKEEDFKKRMQILEHNFLNEKKILQEEIENQKNRRDQFEARIEEKFKKDVKSLEQKFSFEKKRLLDQIDLMKSQQKDDEKSNKSHIEKLETEAQQKLLAAEECYSVEKQRLMDQIEVEKLNTEKVKRAVETDLLRELKKQEEIFLDEKKVLEDRINSLNYQIVDERSRTEESISSCNFKHTQELDALEKKLAHEKAELQEEINCLRSQIGQLENEINEKALEKVTVMKQSFEDEKKTMLHQIELLKSEQKEKDHIIKQVQLDHTKELDELLAQLDLVEAEHQEIINQKQRAILEKESLMAALGVQLGESQRRITDLDQKLAEQCDILDHTNHKLKSTEEALVASKTDLQTMKENHQKYIREAEVAQTKACDQAREEMIERAEAQFQQANEHYVKLKKQFDGAQSLISKLESQLKESLKKLDFAIKEKNSCEINLKAEITQLVAAKAKTEAEAAQMTREYRREMDRLIQTAKDYEAKVHETEKTSRNIQTTLATVVAEKQKLQQEYEEMKSVSEELMALVEGQPLR